MLKKVFGKYLFRSKETSKEHYIHWYIMLAVSSSVGTVLALIQYWTQYSS